MSGLERKSIDKPDEVRTFDKGSVEIVQLGSVTFSRAVFQPGWRWSECVKPIAGTDWCQAQHKTYIQSGSLGVRLQDGTELVGNAGDVLVIPPGHDGWVIGEEPCVSFDFDDSAANYAKPA